MTGSLSLRLDMSWDRIEQRHRVVLSTLSGYGLRLVILSCEVGRKFIASP
jgi:hypothetical protein